VRRDRLQGAADVITALAAQAPAIVRRRHRHDIAAAQRGS
jgi:hypothetical protein